MRELPRDLVTILRTEARNQRTPPIDYAVAEDDDRIRREMDEILRKQSERDIPFVPSTRPSEQAVTEASRAMLEAIDAELDTDSRSAAFLGRVSRLRAALKAAMEAGR